ncbi:DNA gyrase subunit A [Humisphaera borealis]|uniref:DNA topoisomerase (ATP-hydrolyzing) n=1 Tax=Humisphaera borealis TaxID=2807512 RepID=A0A7M2X2H3_9BACT|nr:DNA gyrase subunit A [Humisphaera borealis]QOV91874.1 DNA gyrase subunit A [Humisphaera borealis]
MAETTPPTDANAAPQPERIEDLRIEQELQDSYLTYAMSTIMDRALPDVRDGLKPSQRRILVAMNDLGLGPRAKHRKCAKIAGDTSGNYHPHGEAVIYPTLVRLAQDWTLRSTLIDGQGNFGSTDGDPPAAMRYTEARMTGVAMELMADMEYDTVDFISNYDETREEPTVFPSKFPNLLVNGSTGIAVGMACNLLPHNPSEICDAIVKVIDNPDVTLAELMEVVPGPDFPTGGIICGRDGIIDGYRSGRGKVTLRAKVEVEEQGKGQRPIVVISELPYGIIRKTIMESIASNVKDGVINDVSDCNDHSGREHKVRIVVDLKRDADPQVVINQLYKHTPCQITVSMINIALVNRQPRTMGLKELIFHFIEHRKVVITRRTKFLLRRAQQAAHILEGKIFAVCDIDEVIKLIRSSKTRDEAIQKLKERAFRISADHPFAPRIPQKLLDRAADRGVLLSDAQAKAIGALQLIQLVGLEIERLVDEYRTLMDEIEGYLKILGDEREVMAIIRADTVMLKEKYGDERRTKIEGAATDMNMEDLIAQEDMIVTVSHEGYIKRLPATTYRAQGRGGRGIRGTESREGDFVEQLFVANTHDHLLFFTNKGRVYERKVYNVPQGSRTSMGRSVAQLLEFQPGEKLANTLAVKDLSKEEQFLLFATCRGVVKKTPLSAFANIRNNGIIAISLDEGTEGENATGSDELVGVQITNGKDDVILGTKSGLAIRFSEEDIRSMGRTAGGVTGARFKRENDEVIAMIVVGDDQRQCKMLTATANGYGKRTPLEDYPVKGRGTRGVINIDTSERNGDVVSIKLVNDTDEVIFITQKGILMRTRVAEVRETGRNAQGVRLIKVDEGDRLVAMAKVDPSEAAEESATGETPVTDAATDGTATDTTAPNQTPPDEPGEAIDPVDPEA